MKGTNLETCVVCLEDGNGQTRGTGFVVTPSLAVTCAHVVEACGAGPGEWVRLAFHAGGELVEAEVLADGWDSEADVAFLRLAGPLPEGVLPVTLGPATGSGGHDYLALGYPEDGEVQARWPQGRIGGMVPVAGWKTELLQVQGTEVDRGLSGAPVLDLDADRIVGMLTGYKDLVRSQDTPQMRFAYAIPAEALRDLCPEKLALQPTDVYFQERRLFGVPFQAPAVPPYFVPRPEVSQALMDYLTADAPAGALVVSAVHGLGGIGKTTLVAALAHTPDVQARFSDGVLWVTLGQQPDVLSLLVGWIQALGDYDFRPTVVESASAHLRTLLHDKACLLVVDDAWDVAHATPFLVGGPRCRVLITTREALIAKAVGAALYDLDVMTQDQSLALLTGRLGRDLEGAEQEHTSALAETVGYLPLALELAAAQVADGIPWTELLADLRAEIARLEALEIPGAEGVTEEASRKRLSLLASFNLSLRRLSEDRRQNFAWLGVMTEDVTLTPVMAATLWETDVWVARGTLRYLRDKALLLAGPSLLDGTVSYRLHNLLHDLACRLLTAPLRPKRADDLPGLGLTLPEAHAALLERYQARTQDNCWPTLPDDGYIHAHLTWHMEQAGQVEAIHALLRQETREGRNAWYQARETLGQTAGYLADVQRGWRLAEENFTTQNSKFAVGLLCRYSLLIASLSSLAKSIPPELLIALVKRGIWPATQGLAYARQVTEPTRLAKALTGLIPHLSEPDREQALREALVVARDIEDKAKQMQALRELSPYLSESEREQALREALAAARMITWETLRAITLEELVHYLPESLLGEALAVARTIRDEGNRARALIELVPRLSGTEQEDALRETVTAMQVLAQTPQNDDQNTTLGTLIELFSLLIERGYIKEALAVMQLNGQGEWREVQEVLASRLTLLAGSEEMLEKRLTVARSVEDAKVRAVMLADLAPHLPTMEQTQALWEALEAVRAIDNDFLKRALLKQLAHYLSEPMLSKALVIAKTTTIVRQAEAWGVLAPYLSSRLLNEALRIALTFEKRDRVEALADIAPFFPEPLLNEALTAVRVIEDQQDRAMVLYFLASCLSKPLLSRALAPMRALWNQYFRSKVKALWNLHHRSKVSETVVARLRERVLAMALTATQTSMGEYWQAKVLERLAPHLSGGLLAKALAMVWTIETGSTQLQTLARLVPHLPEELLAEAITAARAIESGHWRAEALGRLAPYLPDRLLAEALVAVLTMEDATDRAWALPRLAPYLPAEELLIEELALVQAIENECEWAKVFVRLSSRLAELGHPEKAQAIAQAIKTKPDRARVLVGLSLRITRLGHPKEALIIARAIGDKLYRQEALTGLAPHLVALPSMTLFSLWCETLSVLAHRTRKDLLSDLGTLSPVLAALGGEEAIAETFRAIQDVGRWWP